MGSIKDLDSTAIYAYTTLISVLICVPAALFFEGPYLRAAADKAVAAHPDFYFSLFLVGLLYHLYNQARALCCTVLPHVIISCALHACHFAVLERLPGLVPALHLHHSKGGAHSTAEHTFSPLCGPAAICAARACVSGQLQLVFAGVSSDMDMGQQADT